MCFSRRGGIPVSLTSRSFANPADRLKATSAMTGTIRAARVPYDDDTDEYDEAVALLDQHAGCYPTKAELRVSQKEDRQEAFLSHFSFATSIHALRMPNRVPNNPLDSVPGPSLLQSPRSQLKQ